MTDVPTGLMADVAVVVLCHDRLEEVRATVPERVEDVHTHGLELVVVDNASTDGTREWLSALHVEDPCFELVLNDQNLGVGAGRNSGWRCTGRDIVVTLDEDTRMTSAQLAEVAERLRDDESLGIVHPLTVDAGTGAPIAPVTPAPHLSTNFQGACYAIHRRALDLSEPHDPRCDFGGEELDLSVRVRVAGFEVLQLVDVRVGHPAIKRGAVESRRRRERWTQNHARVVWRWFPAHRAATWSLLMLLGEVRASMRQGSQGAILELVRAWLAGAAEGRAEHRPIPRRVTRFYAGRLGVRAAASRLIRSRS